MAELEVVVPGPQQEFVVSDEINASCIMNAAETDMPFTKALIGQMTTTALDGNFIKISQPEDNERFYHSSQYDIREIEMPSFKEATIVDAQFISPANNIPELYLRTIVFNPRLTYNYYTNEQDSVKDTVAYVSRMVGWYPATYDVPDGLGEENAQALFKNSGCLKEVDGEVCVEFKNKLDGQTDLMMTDMREGRIYKESFVNNTNPGCDRNIQPFGAYYNGFINGVDLKYCNYFTFHHYLTAVRLFVRADDKSSLVLSTWGHINNVFLPDQPKSATIAIPTEQSTTDEPSKRIPGGLKSLPFEGVEPIFGKVKVWSDYADFPVVRTEMFDSNSPDDQDLGTLTSELPIDLDGMTYIDKTYLGYSLIRPFVDDNNDGKDDLDPEYKPSVQLVTDAGIISAELPLSFGDTKLMQPGSIYDIVIDIKTDGTLDVIVTAEGEQHYRNLSPYNEEKGEYETANSYIIRKSDLIDENDKEYDGFIFYPEIPEMVDGKPYYQNNDIKTVAIYWQDETLPIAHVDYVQDHIRLILNDDSIGGNLVEGNAVIAAYNDKKNVVWSWHIWVVDDVQDVEMTMGDGTVKFMDRNIGALKVAGNDAASNLSSYGLYYQWGRKDPSPGPPSYDYGLFDMSVAPISTLNGTQTSVVDKIVNRTTVSDAARYPLALFYPGDPAQYSYNWLYQRDDSLWGWDYVTGTGEKSDFDPCPYGYRVPFQELEAVTIEGSVSFSTARVTVETEDGTLYFPYTGWKGDDVGSPQQTHFWYKVNNGADLQNGLADIQGNKGYHRERLLFLREGFSVLSTGYSYSGNTLYTPFSNANRGYGNRNAAAPVRCVRENDNTAFYSSGNVLFTGQNYLLNLNLLTVNCNIVDLELTDGDNTSYIGLNHFRSLPLNLPDLSSYSEMVELFVRTSNGDKISIGTPLIMREMTEASRMKDGGHYMIFAQDGNYSTYCLEVQNGKLVCVRRNELTQNNIFIFKQTDNPGSSGSYNSASFGTLQRYSDNYYLMEDFSFAENPNGVVLEFKNRWGSEVGHDIDITKNSDTSSYLIYGDIRDLMDLSWGGSGWHYKWYVYPVNPDFVPEN